jgi:hypothetical protein
MNVSNKIVLRAARVRSNLCPRDTICPRHKRANICLVFNSITSLHHPVRLPAPLTKAHHDDGSAFLVLQNFRLLQLYVHNVRND